MAELQRVTASVAAFNGAIECVDDLLRLSDGFEEAQTKADVQAARAAKRAAKKKINKKEA